MKAIIKMAFGAAIGIAAGIAIKILFDFLTH
jgi:hypothetical protein